MDMIDFQGGMAFCFCFKKPDSKTTASSLIELVNRGTHSCSRHMEHMWPGLCGGYATCTRSTSATEIVCRLSFHLKLRGINDEKCIVERQVCSSDKPVQNSSVVDCCFPRGEPADWAVRSRKKSFRPFTSASKAAHIVVSSLPSSVAQSQHEVA